MADMTKFTLDQELTMFYYWSQGFYREDIPHFEENTFHFSKAFRKIKDGANLTQLVASAKETNIDTEKFMETVGAVTPIDYYGARATALKFQQDGYIANLNNAKSEDIQTYISKITDIQNFIDSKEYQPKCSNFADTFFTELDSRQNENNPRYGIKLLDEETEGLHRGQLVVLGARPSCGKSVFGLQVANNVVKEGFKCMYLPLEMTEYETFQRMIVQEQIVYDAEEVKNPTETQKEKIRKFLNEREESGLFSMYYGLNSVAGIEKKIQEEKPFLVVIDQLTQLDPVEKTRDIRDKYMMLTASLKRIALNENVCILALHQLNRPAESQKTLNLSNLAESDSVGRDADVVLMLSTEEKEEDENKKKEKSVFDDEKLTLTDCIIVKNRQGRRGKKIHLALNGERYTFSPALPSAYERYVHR